MTSRNTITVIVLGPVGCGKSAIAGEIEIALRAIGVEVEHADPAVALSEQRLTHADWHEALSLYNPRVILVEEIRP